MRTVLLLLAVFALVTPAIMMGQYQLVTTRPETANNTGTLTYWCSQVGPPGTPLVNPVTTLSGGVPVTTSWGILSPQNIAIEDEALASDHWSGDFLQNDCLAVSGNSFPVVKFSRPVSQFGFQIEYYPHSSFDTLTVTAKDCGSKILFSSNYVIPATDHKQDGSSPYIGVEDTSGSPSICEVDYLLVSESYALNEPSITVPNDPYCYAPPNTTMVAWYPFDEPSPVNTSANLASADLGLQYNGPLGITAGEVAGAASFNGTNQYVESPSTIATNFGPGITPTACTGPGYSGSGGYSACLGNFSIDTWINVPTGTTTDVLTIVDKRSGSIPLIYGYLLAVETNQQGLVLQLADGGAAPGFTNYHSPTLSPPLQGTGWHHIAVTVNRLSPITWYYDGKNIGVDNPVDRQGSLVNSSPLRIGTRSGKPPLSGWFRGALDELEIYNRELTGAEVNGIYQAGSHGKCK